MDAVTAVVRQAYSYNQALQGHQGRGYQEAAELKLQRSSPAWDPSLQGVEGRGGGSDGFGVRDLVRR